MEQGKLECLALSGPWLGKKESDVSGFVLRDDDILQIESVLGSPFSQIFACDINPHSRKVVQTKLLSHLSDKALQGHTTLVILPKTHIEMSMPVIRDTPLHDPTTQLVVVMEGHNDSTPDSTFTKGWTRLWTIPHGQKILARVGDVLAQRRCNRAIHAYMRVAKPKSSVLSMNPLGLTMEFQGTVANASANILLDSGAGASFLDARFARIHGITVNPAKGTITVGDNSNTDIIGECTLKVVIQKFGQNVQFKVINLIDGVDAILGEPWLKRHGVHLDYEHDVVRIQRHHREVTLFSYVTPKVGTSVPVPLSAMQLKRKLRKGAQVLLGVLQPIPDESRQEPSEVADILAEYADVFEPQPNGLPPERGVTHTIPLEPGAIAPFRPIYRLSPAEMAEAKKQITEYLAKGWIEPSTSPFGAPILFVSKKDGGLRMCVDYRALNKVTVRNRYPLPRIEDLFDQLQGACYFSSIDLAQGYHQLRVTPEDVPKTAFRTPFGHFQFKVLNFGLTNAPATFQSAMNNVFKDVMGKFVLVYLDDILIFSKNLEEHRMHVRHVLETLRKQRFYAKASKCTFCSSELEYLGHIVGRDGIKVDPRKVSAVVDWPIPKDVHQVRSFLGLANYFRRFIQGYSTMVGPLTSLTGKSTPWNWDEQCQAAFTKVKHSLVNAPVLALPNPDEPYEVICDASIIGLGAVLMQNGRPVAFESRKLTPAETRYTTTEQELLAVVHAMRTWRCYLEGCTQCTVVTDHCPLTFFETQQNLSRRQARWSEYLSRFRFNWVYRPGRSNVADPLSRNPVQVALLTVVLTRAKTSGATAGVTERSTISPCLQRTTDLPSLMTEWPAFHARIRAGYVADPWFQDPRNLAKLKSESGLWWKDDCVVVPDVPQLRKEILREFHDTPWSGHFGPRKTLKLIRGAYWWDGLSTDVERYCASCDPCARNKPSNQREAGMLQPLPIPKHPWESISMDFVMGLPETKNNYTAILVFVDRLTKMVHLVPTTDTVDATGTAHLFIRWVFSLHGLPKSIVADRDPRFTSKLWATLMENLQTKVNLSTAFHPQTDGQTERANRTLEQMLRMFVNSAQDDWDEYLPFVEFAYNNATQDSTGNTPFVLNHGRHPLTPAKRQGRPRIQGPGARSFRVRMHTLLEDAKDCLKRAQARQKAYADRSRREKEFAIGTKILLSTKHLQLKVPGAKKLWPRWIGPYEIIQRVGPVAYKLRLPDNLKIHDVFHVSLLAEYKADGTVQPPPAQLIDGQEEYEIDRVLQHRDQISGRRTKRFYLVSWLGYGPDHNTWEPEDNLQDCAALDEYWEEQAERTRKRAAKGVLATQRKPRKRPRHMQGRADAPT